MTFFERSYESSVLMVQCQSIFFDVLVQLLSSQQILLVDVIMIGLKGSKTQPHDDRDNCFLPFELKKRAPAV